MWNENDTDRLRQNGWHDLKNGRWVSPYRDGTEMSHAEACAVEARHHWEIR